MMRRAIAIGLALVLGGCAETIARAAVDAAYLHDAASDYVRETHVLRQAIRKACRASVERDIQRLIEAGEEAALRSMLRDVYPPLVTMDIIDSALEGRSSILSEPPGCG